MPPKGTKRKRRNAGSPVKRCGDYGGLGTNGKPCRRRSNKLCGVHGGDGTEALDDEITNKLVGALMAGSYLEPAAEAHGVSRRTVGDWIKKGEAEPNGPYGEFFRKIEQAKAYAELNAIEAIRTAGVGRKALKTRTRINTDGEIEKTVEEWTDADYRALTWWLERARPSRWKKDVGSMNTGNGDKSGVIRVTEIRERYAEEKPDEEEKGE